MIPEAFCEVPRGGRVRVAADGTDVTPAHSLHVRYVILPRRCAWPGKPAFVVATKLGADTQSDLGGPAITARATRATCRAFAVAGR